MSGEGKMAIRSWLRLLDCARGIEKTLQSRLGEQFDSTLPRFDVLSALHRHPQGLSMSALTTLLRVTNGNTTGIVRRLEEDGLITRARLDGDRRTAHVQLTVQGASLFAQMAQAHEEWVASLFAALSDQEQNALIGMLERLRAAHRAQSSAAR